MKYKYTFVCDDCRDGKCTMVTIREKYGFTTEDYPNSCPYEGSFAKWELVGEEEIKENEK